MELRYIHEVSTIASSRRQQISVASHRERIFCKSCNKHFKDLEDEAVDLLEWMAKGRFIQLGDTERDVLARWGAKTGFALLAAEKELRTLVPTDHTYHLRQRGIPHPMNWVGYASWDGHVFKCANPQTISFPEPLPGVVNAFRAYHEVLTLPGIAFKLFGLIDPIPGQVIGSDWPELRQVWPEVSHPVSWPLNPVTHDRDWERLCSVLPLTP